MKPDFTACRGVALARMAADGTRIRSKFDIAARRIKQCAER
jgi:hypothetical protein